MGYILNQDDRLISSLLVIILESYANQYDVHRPTAPDGVSWLAGERLGHWLAPKLG